MKPLLSLVVLAALPGTVLAQQDPVERLGEVLPPEIAGQVIERIESARARELPTQAMASLALEGVAKGRSSEEVLLAVEALAGDLGRAHAALSGEGRAPQAGEIEAAAAAMRMGVDAEAVSALARSGPSGRTLSVPLLIMGGLSDRGLPSDQALTRVLERLTARADDAGLLGDFPEVGRGLGSAMRPEEVGRALASGFAGFEVPVAGMRVPVGPQRERPDAPGRGRRPGGF
jgi:hypothetical protein